MAHTGTILVIDDDPAAREIARRSLRRDGHKILEAATGEDALARVSAEEIDVVVLDLRMPGMDGFTILESLRRFFSMFELPIAVVSASNEPDDVVKALQQGANDYVQKPYDSRVLRARIGTLLQLKKAVDKLKRRSPDMCDAILSSMGLKGGEQPSEDVAGRVLVADDDPEVRDLLSRVMERERFKVATASDGPGCLHLVTSKRFDVLLLDVNMPGLSGYRTLARVRKTHNFMRLPVILVTARDEPEDVVRGLDLGASDYVTKPFVRTVVAARVRSQVLLARFYRALRKQEKAAKEGKTVVSPVRAPASSQDARITKVLERLRKEFDVISRASPEVVLGVPGRASRELVDQALYRLRSRYEGIIRDGSLPEEAHGLARQIQALVQESHKELTRSPVGNATTSYLNVIENAVEARLDRARLLIAQEEWAEAEQLLARAQELVPSHPAILALMGWARYNNTSLSRLQRVNEAKGLLDRAERLDTACYEGQLYYSLVLEAEGRLEDALIRARRAVKANPDSSDARKIRARLRS